MTPGLAPARVIASHTRRVANLCDLLDSTWCRGGGPGDMSDGDERASVVSEASYRERGGSADVLVKKVFARLCHDREMSTKQHLDAAEALADAQKALESGQTVSGEAQMELAFTCAALMRRVTRMRSQIALLQYASGETGGSSSSSLDCVNHIEADIVNIRHTLMLVFVVVSTADLVARGGVLADVAAARTLLNDALDRSLWVELVKQSKRRSEAAEDVEENERQRMEMEELADRPFASSEVSSSSWREALAQPGALAGAAVRVCGAMLSDASGEDDVAQLKHLADTFGRSTAAQLSIQLLRSDRSFCSLNCQTITSTSDRDRENAMLSVVRAAESESGQAVLRDLVLSFLAPKRVVGTRRTLLLPRDVADAINKDLPWLAAIAHSAAMQGAEWVWRHSRSELKRTCALLAGVALLTTKGTDDVIRKATAFGGVVQLPFLEVPNPERRTQHRLALVPTSRAWVLYSLQSSGQPAVEVSKAGFDGLIFCVLALRNSL
jgi:hypothetical protein